MRHVVRLAVLVLALVGPVVANPLPFPPREREQGAAERTDLTVAAAGVAILALVVLGVTLRSRRKPE